MLILLDPGRQDFFDFFGRYLARVSLSATLTPPNPLSWKNGEGGLSENVTYIFFGVLGDGGRSGKKNVSYILLECVSTGCKGAFYAAPGYGLLLVDD